MKLYSRKFRLLIVLGLCLGLICLNSPNLSFSISAIEETGSLTSRSNPERSVENSDSSLNASLDGQIEYYLEQTHATSLAAAIIRNGKLFWAKGYGNQSAIDISYLIGSITKTFTATALMQLYEQGLFDLDDDVNAYLPFVLRNPNYLDKAITFRMLLSHTASLGLNETAYFLFSYEDLYKQSGYSTESYPLYPLWFEEILLPNGSFYQPDVWGSWAPGDRFFYSSLGFGILGYLIELLSNQSLEQYFMNNIFLPLNMTHTAFNSSFLEMDKLAVPHEWITTMPIYDVIPVGSHGLKSSIVDLSHYLLAHINGGVYQGVRLLEESSLNLMQDSRHGEEYGFGWDFDITIRNDPSPPAQGHFGTDLGFTAAMWGVRPFGTSELPYGVIILLDQHGIDWDKPPLLNMLFQVAETGFINRPLKTDGFSTISMIGCLLVMVIVIVLKKKRNQ
ncbi:MAG: serine hydrolase domain-containing protein [Candidatus Hodarchaeota archaeon]